MDRLAACEAQTRASSPTGGIWPGTQARPLIRLEADFLCGQTGACIHAGALDATAQPVERQRHLRREGTYDPNSLYLRPPTVGSNLE